MNLLSALPDLKKKPTGYLEDIQNERWNEYLDDLAKYELCEESLAKVIENWDENHSTRNMKNPGQHLAKAILSKTNLWIKRKES